MFKEIKTEKFEGLAVLVPDGFKGGIANMGYLIGKVDNPATMIHEKHFNSPINIQKQLDRVNKLPEFVMLPAIKIPEGDYKILGKATELTEEQCADLLMHKDGYGQSYQLPKPHHRAAFFKAKDAFKSLLYCLGCFTLDENNEPQTGTWIILQKLRHDRARNL